MDGDFHRCAQCLADLVSGREQALPVRGTEGMELRLFRIGAVDGQLIVGNLSLEVGQLVQHHRGIALKRSLGSFRPGSEALSGL